MDGLSYLLLHMANKMNGERSLAGSYHILTGKKSGQAIQDASLFGFQSWYGLFSGWGRDSFDKIVADLILSGYLVPSGEAYFLTAKAQTELRSKLESYRFAERAFLVSEEIRVQQIILFWKRFHLLSQVMSHYLHQDRHYQPIITEIDVQLWMKPFWSSISSKDEFAKQMLTEVASYLHSFEDELLAQLIVDRLSGYRTAGRTFQQMAHEYRIPEALIRLFFFQAVGLLLTSILDNPLSILKKMIDHHDQDLAQLTHSAQKTYQLLTKGYTLETVGQMRQLKRSTIEDHLVEIAIHIPQFDVTPYLSKELMEKVLFTSGRLGTKKLRSIKEALHEEVDYVQIRLALVRGNSL